jgi:microcystin-dependent protein
MAILAAASAIAYAGVPKTWIANDRLTSLDLNMNFQALDTRLAILEASALPSGSIVAFGGAVAPAGWVLCDGTPLDGTKPQYATLYAAIGTAFGGNAATRSFVLPDLRGRFLRGADNGTGHDPDAAQRTSSSAGGNTGAMLGTLQGEGFASHTHGVVDPGHAHGVVAHSAMGETSIAVGGVWVDGGNNWALATNLGTPANVSAASAMTKITLQNAGGAETRPKNVAVNYIIKL